MMGGTWASLATQAPFWIGVYIVGAMLLRVAMCQTWKAYSDGKQWRLILAAEREYKQRHGWRPEE